MPRKKPSWLMQLVTIAEKGAGARRAGLPRECPFATRGYGQGFQGQRRKAWLDGWDAADREIQESSHEGRQP
jgi:hypothetical protein